MARARIPWPPEIPARLRNVLAPFTPYAGGWCRWDGTRMVHVCGKATPLDEIEERWVAKRKERAQADSAAYVAKRDGMAYAEAASLFFQWLDRCVTTGRPKRLSPATVEDYKREVLGFGEHFGLTNPIADADTPHFTDYARRYDANAPGTLARVVAYVTAFFRWCADERHIPAVPNFGRWFAKPQTQDVRDKRLGETKSYTGEELWKLWAVADTEVWAWMAMALCGAFDNADIANLTFDVLDRKRGVIDYRRRKRGKRQRVVPVPAWAWRALDAWLAVRPEPADPVDAERVFLTPTGLPLQRMKPSPNRPGRSSPLDYVAMRWTRVMIRAGLRPPIKRKKRGAEPTPRRVKAKGSAAGQGFRAIRTTWGNLVPPGYGDERSIVMGHHAGTTFVESYLERFGVERLSELVVHVWSAALTDDSMLLPPRGEDPPTP